MSEFVWDEEKNSFLRDARGVSFEDILFHIGNGDLLDVIRHPNLKRYPNQLVMVVNVEGYAYLVPYVKDGGRRFLKTIIPSRRATKEYLE